MNKFTPFILSLLFLALLGAIAWWTQGMLEGSRGLPGTESQVTVKGADTWNVLETSTFKSLVNNAPLVPESTQAGNPNPFSRLSNVQ